MKVEISCLFFIYQVSFMSKIQSYLYESFYLSCICSEPNSLKLINTRHLHLRLSSQLYWFHYDEVIWVFWYNAMSTVGACCMWLNKWVHCECCCLCHLFEWKTEGSRWLMLYYSVRENCICNKAHVKTSDLIKARKINKTCFTTSCYLTIDCLFLPFS